MKKFSEYIKVNEELEEQTLLNVIATYKPTHEVKAKIPREWDNDDLKNFLVDKYSSNMPSAPEISEQKFGVNAENIVDAQFNFDEVIDNSTYEGDVDFSVEDKDLVNVIIKNFTFTIIFDSFKIKTFNSSTIYQDLSKIFKATDGNGGGKYPCELRVSVKYNTT